MKKENSAKRGGCAGEARAQLSGAGAGRRAARGARGDRRARRVVSVARGAGLTPRSAPASHARVHVAPQSQRTVRTRRLHNAHRRFAAAARVAPFVSTRISTVNLPDFGGRASAELAPAIYIFVHFTL